MDILDRLLRLAQVRGRLDVQCAFGGGWSVRHEARRAQGLAHIVTEGEGWLHADGAAPQKLSAGDVVFFPRTAGHTLGSSAACIRHDPPEILRNGVFTLKRSGTAGAQTRLFCARFGYEERAALVSALPETMLLRVESAALAPLVALLQHEAAAPQYGASAVADALSQVLLVHLIRSWLASGGSLPAGILKGWQDTRLRPVVQAVVERPEHGWTVEEMAKTACLSRAQLMRLFQSRVGSSPYAFVQKNRLDKAAAMLRGNRDSVLSVALACGFQSETHFGKVFKKQFGQTPKHYRTAPDDGLYGQDGGYGI